jgi:hypothetical protein
MTFYTGLKSTASKLLTKYGAAATLTQRSAGAYDVSTGSATVTETATTVKAAVFDYPERAIDGTRVLQGDKQAYIAAGGTVPQAGMFLTWRGVLNAVIDCKPVSPGGVDVVYIAQIRA